jgi:hypothetical protein
LQARGLSASAAADTRQTGIIEGRREADGEYYENDQDNDVIDDAERAGDRERRRPTGGTTTGYQDELVSRPEEYAEGDTSVAVLADPDASVVAEAQAEVWTAEGGPASSEDAADAFAPENQADIQAEDPTEASVPEEPEEGAAAEVPQDLESGVDAFADMPDESMSGAS